ncbi:hypothetical protein PG984_001131 [Apiospora sp. TS-2023a]
MTATEDSSAAVASSIQASPQDVAPPGAACSATNNKKTQQVRDALSMLFGFRLLNALCLRTFFQPDEYYQALEPAWKIAFGLDSGPWTTWEWQYYLRSSLHPGLFSLGYTLTASYMSSMRLSPHYTGIALVAVPKVMQAGIAALTDWYAWRLAEKLYGGNSAAAWSVLLMSIANPWVWYVSTRTFSNTMEAALTIAALYYFPWDLLGVEKKVKEKDKPAVLGTLGAVNRQASTFKMPCYEYILTYKPTNAVIWAAIGIVVLTGFTAEGESPLDTRTYLIIIREVLLCGSLVLGLSLAADYQLNTAVLYNDCPLCRNGHVQCCFGELFWLPDDEEYPESPGLHIYGRDIGTFLGIAQGSTVPVPPCARTPRPRCSLHYVIFHNHHCWGIPSSSGPIGVKRKPLLVAGLFVNLVIGSYLSYFHAAAPIQVMNYLRGEFERLHPDNATLAEPYGRYNATSEPLELFALFLTPCHTTPWRSHLVYPALRARELTCEPPLHTEPGSPERAAYIDEGWRFERDKMGFMSTELWPSEGGEEIPRYIIGFEGIEDALMDYFGPQGPGANKGVTLAKTWAQWNGLFTDDDRKAGELRVWETNAYSAATNGPAEDGRA